MNLIMITYNYLEQKSQRNRANWLSEKMASISSGVGCRFAFNQKLALNFLNRVGIKNHSMIFFNLGPQ